MGYLKCMNLESRIRYNYSERWNLVPNDLKLRPIVGGPKCKTKELRLLIDIILKLFLKCIKIFIHDSFEFFD